MHFGASMFFTDYSMTAAALAKALEERGFESVWAPEHSHIPLSRRSPWPRRRRTAQAVLRRDGSIRDPDRRGDGDHELKLGTGVCLVNQRDPIQTAKLVASIDQISGGRFLFGIGVGWNAEEMEDHGTNFATRAKLVRERVEAMKAIWTQAKPEYSGEFVNFAADDDLAEAGAAAAIPRSSSAVPSHTAPAAPPATAKAGSRSPAGPDNMATSSETLPKFHAMLKEAGRDPASCPVSIFSGPEDADTLKRYRDLGIARVATSLPAAKEDVVLPILDRWAALIRQTAT